MELESIKAKFIEAATKAYHEVLLPQVEVEIEKQINAKCDLIADKALTALANLIPGGIDNALIAQYSPKLKADIKALLLAEAEKISDKV